MKSISKRICRWGLAACLAVFTATAQENDSGPEAPPGDEPSAPSGSLDRVDQLGDLLKLSSKQRAQIKPLVDAETKKMQELRGLKMTRQERSARFKALREETYQQIKPLLTPAQVARWDQIRNFKPTLPAKTNAVPTNAAPARTAPAAGK